MIAPTFAGLWCLALEKMTGQWISCPESRDSVVREDPLGRLLRQAEFDHLTTPLKRHPFRDFAEILRNVELNYFRHDAPPAPDSFLVIGTPVGAKSCSALAELQPSGRESTNQVF